jgi:protein-disulfide isomerase/uncharacterized membrane protein
VKPEASTEIATVEYDPGSMRLKTRVTAALVLSLGGAVLAGVLLLEYHGEPAVSAVEAICGDAASNGCQAVARSAYAHVASVPLAALGLLFYVSLASLLLLALLADAETVPAGARVAAAAFAAALAIDVALLGLQAFAIRAYCALCIATYAVNVAALFVLFPALRGAEGRVARLLRGEARPALAGWLLATGAAAAAIAAANLALTYRAERRAANLLGEPTAVTAGSSDPLARAQEEARRLKETLDDPQKREQYVTDKAVKEFEDATPLAFDLAGTPVEGPPAAPVQVVEFSDFLCPWCRALAVALKDFLPKSGSRLAIHFKNYPLDKSCNPHLQATVHEGACWLALGGLCAQDQGRFWPYHDRIFGTQMEKVGREDVGRLAGEAGLDRRALDACLDSPRTRERLAAQVAEAERSGVKGTPTVFLNGKRLPRVNDFLLAVDKESVRLGLPPLSASPAR